VIEKSSFAAIAFAGAALALLAAKYLFGAIGTETPENIAFVGFVVCFGTRVFLELRKGAQARG
jgi:hypothetical protein